MNTKEQLPSGILRLDFVSVIVPCFNGSSFIEETINSVLAQTHEDLELIVVDDCSSDNSAEIVAAVSARDPRVSLLRMKANSGTPAAPRNVGISAAKGTWLAFLDADDIWHPRKLEFQLRALREREALVCSTQMRDFRFASEIRMSEPNRLRVQAVTFLMQLVKYRTPTSSILIHRDLMSGESFKKELEFKAREDTDCFIRVHEYVDSSVKLLHPFVFYRLQGKQISGNKARMVYRHFNMLKKYRLRSGATLGIGAYVFTVTHFVISVYYRLIRKML